MLSTLLKMNAHGRLEDVPRISELNRLPILTKNPIRGPKMAILSIIQMIDVLVLIAFITIPRIIPITDP